MSAGGRPSSWREVPAASDWVAMEERVLALWRERDVFRRSLEGRAGAPPFVFYEGPPTANGPPGAHHVLSRVFKDIYPRFQTMRGRFVDRRGGWDCHGLPVEIEVEKRLGISGKPQIEAYGIAEFNALCRESVVAYVDEWERLTERIGFWIDTERAYRTMDADYIESVWWSLAELYRRGPALPERQGRALLPALRHGPVEPRGRPRLRGGRRPLGLRPLPAAATSPARRCWSGPPRRGRSRPTRRRRSTPTSPTPRWRPTARR